RASLRRRQQHAAAPRLAASRLAPCRNRRVQDAVDDRASVGVLPDAQPVLVALALSERLRVTTRVAAIRVAACARDDWPLSLPDADGRTVGQRDRAGLRCRLRAHLVLLMLEAAP